VGAAGVLAYAGCMAESPEYERGVAAGQVLARLDSHDSHLGKINGSMERVADELARVRGQNAELLLTIQRLSDSAESDRKTVVTTATALEKADEARRNQEEAGWTPMQRMAIIAAVVVPVLTLVVYIILGLKH
jgi:hypothetical protein